MAVPPLAGTLVPVATPGFTGRMHVREDGPADAPVVLLLHGFSGSLHWHDLAVAELADRFHLVRVDLVGHGATGGPAVDAPVQAAAVESVLAQLDLQSVTAVGHSFGADVAVELAERSSRVSRLVVVTQAPDYSDATLPRGNTIMTVPVLGAALHRTALLLGRGLHATLRATRRPHPAMAAQALRDFAALNSAMFRVVLVERRQRMATRPLDAQLRDAGKPALVVLGGRDHFYGDRSADRYRAAGAQVEVLPDSGHSPLIEFPERTAALIAAFVDDRPDVGS